MGEARRRGTKEERVAQAIEREKRKEHQAKIDQLEQEIKKESEYRAKMKENRKRLSVNLNTRKLSRSLLIDLM